MRMPKMVVPFLLAGFLAGCGDTVGSEGSGTMVTNSGFDAEGDLKYSHQGDVPGPYWISRNPLSSLYSRDMGDGNMGFLMLKKCPCASQQVHVGYVTQDLRIPIRAGQSYIVSVSGTNSVITGGRPLASIYPRIPVRFVAYNGTPPEFPLRWSEKPGEMAIIGQVNITDATWRTYRTAEWKADRDYRSFGVFIGDSIDHSHLPQPDTVIVTSTNEMVFLDNVSLR